MSFRYSDTARTFDEGLVADLHKETEETVEKEAEESALDRIARGKTPLEEVKAVIEAKTKKSASAVLSEYRVGRMMENDTKTDIRSVDEFLKNR